MLRRTRRRDPASASPASGGSALCEHLAAVASSPSTPSTPETLGPGRCEDCAELGEDTWAHLRVCLSCGHVGCCDSSPHQHATEHFHRTGHPVMRSAEPGESWRWCYLDHRVG